MPRLPPWRRSARERDRAAEMRAHLDLYVEELVDGGMSRERATRQARLRFGNPRVKLEEVSDMNRIPILETLVRDARYAIRVLRRAPAFTLTAVTTLALVIGATTAVFSLADALLWRPLPYPNADRLAMLTRIEEGNGRVIVEPWTDGAMWEA